MNTFLIPFESSRHASFFCWSSNGHTRCSNYCLLTCQFMVQWMIWPHWDKRQKKQCKNFWRWQRQKIILFQLKGCLYTIEAGSFFCGGSHRPYQSLWRFLGGMVNDLRRLSARRRATWSSETCHEFEAGKITVDRQRRIATMMSHYCLKVRQQVKFSRWRNVFREKYFLQILSVDSFKMFLKLRIVRHWQISVYFVCFKHVVNIDSQVIHCVHQNESTNVSCVRPAMHL